MEQRKSDINTGDANTINVDTNGLSYSFDFSSQVEPEKNINQVPKQPINQTPVEPAPAPEPVVQTPVEPAPQPVVQAPVEPAPQPVVQTPVEPVSAPEPVVQTPVEPAPQPVVQAPVEPTLAPVNQVQEQDSIPNPQAQTIEQSNVSKAQGNTESSVQEKTVQNDEELIKDKKGTKKFIIIIGIIVIAFIIALPFIFKLIG